MGQFQPMVKMMTTEPSVELKLKKGGKVAKKADGGMMGSPMSAASPMPSSMPARGGMMGAAAPMKPSLAMRRRAMKGMPAGAGPAGPVGSAASMQSPAPMPAPSGMPAMKKGGKAEGGKADMAQDKAMIKKAFKQHDAQEHKGGKGTSLKLKKGGKMATGGVVNGQGGYAKGGIINTEGQGGEYRNTKMDTAKPDHSPAKTGGVKNSNGGGYATGGVAKSNGGGYKKGGSAKKAYAAGGSVNSGRPVAMPQGSKPAPKPVRINELAGTYKAGGKVTPAQGRLQKISDAENAPSFRAAKVNTNERYGSASQMKLAEGGNVDFSKGAYDKAIGPDEDDMAMAKSIRGFPGKVMGKVKSVAKDLFSSAPKADSVTKTKESVTVTPAKKRGGSVKC
jgi:hypothetical protein